MHQVSENNESVKFSWFQFILIQFLFLSLTIGETISFNSRQQWLIDFKCNSSAKATGVTVWDYCRQEASNQARAARLEISFSFICSYRDSNQYS